MADFLSVILKDACSNNQHFFNWKMFHFLFCKIRVHFLYRSFNPESSMRQQNTKADFLSTMLKLPFVHDACTFQRKFVWTNQNSYPNLGRNHTVSKEFLQSLSTLTLLLQGKQWQQPCPTPSHTSQGCWMFFIRMKFMEEKIQSTLKHQRFIKNV